MFQFVTYVITWNDILFSKIYHIVMKIKAPRVIVHYLAGKIYPLMNTRRGGVSGTVAHLVEQLPHSLLAKVEISVSMECVHSC